LQIFLAQAACAWQSEATVNNKQKQNMKTINDIHFSDCHIGLEVYAALDKNEVCIVETDHDHFDKPAVSLVHACPNVAVAERIIACKVESMDNPASLSWEIIVNQPQAQLV